MSEIDRKAANRRLTYKLLTVTALMFGFGYALVPLYSVFCEITGINAKTGRLSDAQAAVMSVDENRTITVEFVTNVNSGMPWLFKPPAHSIEVHPGEATTVEFEVHNNASRPVVGQAIPSIAPSTASRYFTKTECFCFTQQPLAAGERKMMPVRFIIDPKVPADVRRMTLGYTFFEAVASPTANAEVGGSPPKS